MPDLRDNSGAALIIVLWAIILLSVIAAGFSAFARAQAYSVGNFRDETNAEYLALSGYNLAVSKITKGFDLVARDNKGRLIFIEKDGNTTKTFDASGEAALGGGKVFFEIEDEKARLNLNTASPEEIDALLASCGVEKTDRDILTDSIMDWRDENHDHHLNGAESDYYRSLEAPYEAKDGNFDSEEELLLIKGMTPELFYGEGRVPPEITAAKTGGGGARYKAGVRDLFTAKGDGKININTASERVLEAILSRGKAQEVILRRQTEGSFARPEYKGIVTSELFRIRTAGEVNGIRAGITAIVEVKGGKPSVVYWREEGPG